MDFYDLKNIYKPKLMQKHHYLQPKYRLDTDGSVIFSKENIAGIIQVEGSSNFCFCLYADRKFSECLSGEDTYSANKILIFNWNGKPLKVISLEYRYSAMAVNEDKQEILLLGVDDKSNDYVISRLNLNEEFANLDPSL